MEYNEISKEYSELELLAERKAAQLEMLAKRWRDLATRFELLEGEAKLLGDGIMLIQKFSESVQTGVIKRFEDLVTSGMQEIFEEDIEFFIHQEQKANTVWMDFYVRLPNGKELNLAKSEGGGLKDFAAVLKRILYLVLEPSQPSKLIIFDENMKFLDSQSSPKAFKFVIDLLDRLDIQCIWISHNAAVTATENEEMIPSIIRIEKVDGTARVVKIK